MVYFLHMHIAHPNSKLAGMVAVMFGGHRSRPENLLPAVWMQPMRNSVLSIRFPPNSNNSLRPHPFPCPLHFLAWAKKKYMLSSTYNQLFSDHLKSQQTPQKLLIICAPWSYDQILGTHLSVHIYGCLQHPMVTWSRFTTVLPKIKVCCQFLAKTALKQTMGLTMFT